MRHFRFILVFSLLLLSGLAHSQVTEQSFSITVDAIPFLNVMVCDKESESPMEGAAVFLSHGNDTIKSVTNRHGRKVFARHHFREADTLIVDISYMGYKKIRHRQPMKPVVFLKVMMEEDPELINAIIVKGDRVAMVRHGDTTIYNASAIATMEGAKLIDLIRKLPGISVVDNEISAYGERVSKILINGTMLFESNIAAALDMVRSEDVKKIRVYDEHAQDRLVQKDTLDRREKVMDLETKKPFSKAQELVLLALGGVYVDNNSNVGGAIGGIDEKWRSFEKNKPSFQVNAGVGHNVSMGSRNYKLASSPENSAYADLRFSRNQKFKSRMSHFLTFTGSNRTSGMYVTDIYSPTDAFDERTDFRSSETDAESFRARYSGSQGFTIRRNSSVTIGLDLSYNRMEKISVQDMISTTDGTDFIVNRRGNSLDNRYNAGLAVHFDHHFKKDGRKFSAGIDYSGTYGRGNEERTDTLKTSSSPQWLTVGNDNRSNILGLAVSYDEPLIGKNLRLNVSYKVWGDLSVEKKLSFDELLHQPDIINTQDFTHRDFQNRASVGLKWVVLDNALNISADASYIRSDQLRMERVPEVYSQPRSYDQISPGFSMRYSRNGVSVGLNYSESSRIPSMEQTNGMLNNTSHLFLRAGNPDLKASCERSLSARFSLASINNRSSFSAGLNFNNTSNSIADRTIYFSEDTFLEKYGYTAVAGSRLSMPVNVDGRTGLTGTMDWNTYSNLMKSTFTLAVNYGFSRYPFMIGDQLQDKKEHNLGLSLYYISGFSKYFELMVSASAGVGRRLVDGNLFYDHLNGTVDITAKGNFLKHFWVGSDFGTSLYRATMEGLEYDNIRWDMNLTYKFGKKKQAEFILSCDDILDKSVSVIQVMMDNYISSRENTIFGRSVTLAFKYTFR